MALYRKGAGEGLLFIGGSLAHDADCCCSVCSDDITIECCLGGESIATGQCECELFGGYPVTEANPCECVETTVSCCYEGNSISLSACDCAIIGGTANPASCIPLVTEGCDVCISIEIGKQVTPIYWPCVQNNGTCATTPNICAPPAWDPNYQMCFGYEGCNQIGNCITCANDSAYCYLSGERAVFNNDHYESIGTCTNEVIYVANPDYYCTEPCCDGTPINLPYKRTIIYQTVKRCGTFQLTRTNASSDVKTGSGCAQIDTSTINTSDTSVSYTCGTAC